MVEGAAAETAGARLKDIETRRAGVEGVSPRLVSKGHEGSLVVAGDDTPVRVQGREGRLLVGAGTRKSGEWSRAR